MSTLHVMSNSRKHFLFSAALAVVLILFAGGAKAVTITNNVWCVPNTSISTACTGEATHIQDAVYDALAGDVILVGPGYYHEWVNVNVSNLYIFGAQTGKDARTRSGWSNESIVDASPGASGKGEGAAFYIEDHVANVVIDGFTIQGGREEIMGRASICLMTRT